jgi:hypothetical protein
MGKLVLHFVWGIGRVGEMCDESVRGREDHVGRWEIEEVKAMLEMVEELRAVCRAFGAWNGRE